jgi:hypothetical protein
LSPDWLNAAAAPWVPAPAAVELERSVGLTVRYAPAEHLLAMKMVALRQQDAVDVAALAGHLGLVGAPASRFAELLRSVYAGEGVLQQVLGVPDDQVDQEIHAITRRVARFASTPATL